LTPGGPAGDLAAPAGSLLDRAREDRPDPAPILRLEQVGGGAAGEVPLSVAEQPAAGGVHGDEPAIDVGGEDTVVHPLHYRGEEALAAAYLGLRLLERLLHAVERGHELLGLALRDREAVLDDDPGGGGTEGRGEEALEADAQLEELGHRQLGRRLAAEQLADDGARFLLAHEVVYEPLDLGGRQERGRARTRLVLGADAHEGRGLGPIVRLLLGEQRDEDE